MDWVLPVVVTALSAGTGFAGGYFGARWKAGTDLAQWRRDRLLQFCADLLAAGGEIVDVGRDIQHGEQPSYPTEKTKRLEHALGCICLLSDQLADPAQEYASATLAVLKEGLMELDEAKKLTPAMGASAFKRGRFMRAAHDLLLDRRKRPTLWKRARSRISGRKPKAVAKASTPT